MKVHMHFCIRIEGTVLVNKICTQGLTVKCHRKGSYNTEQNIWWVGIQMVEILGGLDSFRHLTNQWIQKEHTWSIMLRASSTSLSCASASMV